MNNIKIKKRKFNIGHVHWAFDPIIGGVETHLKILLPELMKNGYGVFLLTADFKGRPNREKIAGVEVFRSTLLNLDLLMRMDSRNIEKELKTLYFNFIKTTKADIIHVHNMHYFSKIHINILKRVCKEMGIPIVLTAHNVWDDNLYLDIMNSIKWDHIIAVSHFIKRELWGIGIDENKITVIHHGIDVNIYRPGINPKNILKKYPQLIGKKVIFHPARISLAKGCDVSVKAFRLVKRHFKDAFLVLAGSKNIIDWNDLQEKDLAYIKRLIKIFGLEKDILIDAFNQQEMVELYNLSQVTLYPSNAQEPFGLTILESQACGVPIIVTYSGGMPEVIHNKINGYVVPVGDFSQIAYTLMFLLDDPEIRNRLGKTGREIVRYNYTKEIMAQRNIEVYKKVI